MIPKNRSLMVIPKCIRPFTGKERPLSTHKRIYKPGRKFRSMASLVKWLDGGGYVLFRGKSYHPGWVRGFQFGYILWNLKAGQIRKAVR